MHLPLLERTLGIILLGRPLLAAGWRHTAHTAWSGIFEKNGLRFCPALGPASQLRLLRDAKIAVALTPDHTNWHLERDGQLLAAGRGFRACAHRNRSLADHAAARLAARLDELILLLHPPKATFTIDATRRRLSLQFSHKPPTTIRTDLSLHGWAWWRFTRTWRTSDTPTARQYAQGLLQRLRPPATPLLPHPH